MLREPCVYILASWPHGAIYTGVTSDLPRRRGLIDRFNSEWLDLYGDLA